MGSSLFDYLTLSHSDNMIYMRQRIRAVSDKIHAEPALFSCKNTIFRITKNSWTATIQNCFSLKHPLPCSSALIFLHFWTTLIERKLELISSGTALISNGSLTYSETTLISAEKYKISETALFSAYLARISNREAGLALFPPCKTILFFVPNGFDYSYQVTNYDLFEILCFDFWKQNAVNTLIKI